MHDLSTNCTWSKLTGLCKLRFRFSTSRFHCKSNTDYSIPYWHLSIYLSATKSRSSLPNIKLLILAGDVETNPGPITSSLNFYHININSLRHKIDEIESEFEDYDLIAITETKLDQKTSTKELLLDFPRTY